LSSLINECPLNLMVSIAGSFWFFTQFIKSHSLLFFDAISWIFSLKNRYLVFLTILLNFLQSVIDLEIQYMDNSLLYSLFYQALEYLVILTCFKCLIQRFSMMVANSCVISSKELLFCISEVSMLPTLIISLLMNSSSSSLFFIIVFYSPCINSFLIMMFIIKGMWSDGLLKSRISSEGWCEYWFLLSYFEGILSQLPSLTQSCY